jgi:hypothetical protein
MLTEAQKASHAILLLSMNEDGVLNDKFLPPEEFMIVKETPYPEWPQALKDKLAKYTGGWGDPEEE